jgi:hypothetical protein
MWRPPEEIVDDLRSADPARIATALADAVEAMDGLDEIELPPLDASILAPFGAAAPANVQRDLARLLWRYREFSPPLERAQRLLRLAELAASYGDNQVAFDAAMAVKNGERPADDVAAIIDHLARRGLSTEAAKLGAGRYASYLLAGEPSVRAATLRALAQAGPALRPVVDFILSELEPDERAAFA